MKRRLIAALWAFTLIVSCASMNKGRAASSGSVRSLPQNVRIIAASKGKEKKPKEIRIEGPKSVNVGEKITLTAAVSPDSASQDVKWKSSDKSIATVSSKGVVKGIKAGKAEITATSKKDSGVTATWKVEVREKQADRPKMLVQELTIQGAKNLDLSGTKKVTLKVSVSPSGASDEVKWKSSEPKIAKVNSKGVVTAVSVGKAEITATAQDGSKKKASVTIRVTDSGAARTPTPTPKATPTPAPTQVFEISEKGVLVKYHGSEKKVTIPDGVRIIGKQAFKDHATLEKVTLPGSVVEIRESAFANCVKLKKVRFASENHLEKIESKAFYRCPITDTSFAETVPDCAKDAFDDSSATPTPDPEEDSDWESDWWWEEDDGGDTQVPSAPGGSGKRQTHGKSTVVMKHDYEQVSLSLDGEQEPMHTLTLDGEQLELTLAGENRQERTFTVSLSEGAAGPETADEDAGNDVIMVLSAVKPEEEAGETDGTLIWSMNGSAMSKLCRSGVTHLSFRSGTETVTVPTEGFLSGWAYDALKSRGTASRRFDYTLTMNAETGAWSWALDVEGTHYELTENPLSAMYLTGVKGEKSKNGPAESQGLTGI